MQIRLPAEYDGRPRNPGGAERNHSVLEAVYCRLCEFVNLP